FKGASPEEGFIGCGWGKILCVGWGRGRAGPDPSGPQKHQGAKGLSGRLLLKRKTATTRIQLCVGRCRSGQQNEIHSDTVSTRVGGAVRNRGAVCIETTVDNGLSL